METSNSQFSPGQHKLKGSGRKKGTPNKKTIALESRLADLGIDPLKIIAEELPNLPPEKRVSAMFDLLKYIYPQRKAIDIPTEEGSDEISPRTAHIIGQLAERSLEFLEKNK